MSVTEGRHFPKWETMKLMKYLWRRLRWRWHYAWCFYGEEAEIPYHHKIAYCQKCERPEFSSEAA